MDQVKIGKFLQELRKEKGLTQEALADRLGVARRTVSRWETGSNMPDLAILVEMADLYEVDLRELMNGERENERMNEELRETVLQVADYSNEEKERMLKRMHYLYIAGFIGFVIFLVITAMGLDETAPYEGIGSFGLGIAFGMVILGMIFTSSYANKIREFKMRVRSERNNGGMDILTRMGIALGALTILIDKLIWELPSVVAVIVFSTAVILALAGLVRSQRG